MVTPTSMPASSVPRSIPASPAQFYVSCRNDLRSTAQAWMVAAAFCARLHGARRRARRGPSCRRPLIVVRKAPKAVTPKAPWANSPSRAAPVQAPAFHRRAGLALWLLHPTCMIMEAAVPAGRYAKPY